jgi:hypothetical protein
MAAAGTLAVNDRVWHESERYVPAGNRRYGVVTKIYTRVGRECAKVRWDRNTLSITYPVSSLTKAAAGS